MLVKTRQLCYLGFAVLHSGLTRTPLYSAEHLSRESLAAAREQVRVDEFHPEPRLPRSERAELADYAHSGFDRGHMAPSGDAASAQAQAQTFTLANMIPQVPENNRGIWSEIESAVRDLAQRRGELYVITGPLFEAADLRMLKGRVFVPTGIFKLVYDPASGRAAAYVSTNDESGTYAVLSLGELEKRAGLQLLPGDPGAHAREPLQLPSPRSARHRHRKRADAAPGERAGEDSVYAVHTRLRRLARQLLR